jgi:uncharacterized protein YjbJ (UPF0337 family)
MNTDKVEGKFDQVAGKIKQKVGETVGNQKLANAGVADQVKGAAKETWGHAKDAASAVNDDTQARARVQGDDWKTRSEEKAHELREKVAATTQHVKDTVNEKLDNIKRDHNR